jgi:hypothetical protein
MDSHQVEQTQTAEITGRNREPEQTIRSEELVIERKTFKISLKENRRGRFIRITEHTGSKRSTVIVPDTGLPSFIAKLNLLQSGG